MCDEVIEWVICDSDSDINGSCRMIHVEMIYVSTVKKLF